MEIADREYLGKHKKFRADYKKLAAIFLALAVVVAIIVFWWLKLVGITITGEAFCGLEEHSHSEDCYISELICGLDDESDSTLPADEEGDEAGTSAESHSHSDECYEKNLTCTLAEHTHTEDCYPDYSADVETQSDWLATFEDVVLTKNVSENIVNIAKTQFGYSESEKNFKYDDEGNKNGYTRYGEWYGNPYGKWNVMFVSFCLSYSDINESERLVSAGAEAMRKLWQDEELFDAADGHTAAEGELIFLDEDDDGAADIVAIISEITDGETGIILGDYEDKVEEISLDDDIKILGYGITSELLTVSEAQALTSETTTEETTTQPPIGFTTTAAESTAATTVQESSSEDSAEEITSEAEKSTEHNHSDNCYNGELLICTEWGKEAPWALDWESDEFEDKAVKYVAYLINQLPAIDEFENKLAEFDEAEDYDGYEAYFKEIYDLVSKAYVNYENLLPELKELVPNRDHLFLYESLYSGSIATMAVTETRTVEFVNYYDEQTTYKSVLIHSGNVGSYSSFGFYWWYAVVVDENEYGELVVTDMYGYELTNKSSLKPSTTNGFVLLSHATAFTCSVGDEVTVNFDYLSSSGKNTSSFGTVTFSEYVPPETTTQPEEEPDPVVEDIPLSDIQDGEFSDVQVKDAGGKTTSGNGDVEISKSIDGTDIENVFDITLTVRTESSMQTYLADPDMAVVIVMDISNTMNTPYPANSSTTRYDAAVVAATNFINQFAEQGKGISKLGFVAFNTHAHEILSLQACTTSNASALISEMGTDTKAIIKASGYADSHDRFTNVEAGLKMGYDMLAASGNENKYIVFLSDGFPTTYLKNGTTTYQGYDPYTSSGTVGADGVFYDSAVGYYCKHGTSYSDKAAIKARTMAEEIKGMGATIFSIGVDVSGQNIYDYEYTDSEYATNKFSIIDRTSRTYEIGDESLNLSDEYEGLRAFEYWLKYSIGSKYYYDSKNQTEITAAFNSIFEAINKLNKESRKTIWTTTDPLPVLGEESATVEFIYFYDKYDNPAVDENNAAVSLDGSFGVGEENTAYHANRTIYWDLKDSGYEEETSEDGNTTYYYYKIKYRVRLYNEGTGFIEYTSYNTNGDAYLEYKTVTTVDDATTVSDNKTLYFEKPAVEGYVAELEFTKQSDLGDPLSGAVFVLSHDDELCSVCQGNGTPVTTVNPLTYTSESDGTVVFTAIPSGHIYNLTEKTAPEGFVLSDRVYKVKISLDELTVYMYASADATEYTVWQGDELTDLAIYNTPLIYVLPETGGTGTLPLTIIGLALMALPVLYSKLRRKRERRFN